MAKIKKENPQFKQKAIRVTEPVFLKVQRIKSCYEVAGILEMPVSYDKLFLHLLDLVKKQESDVWSLFMYEQEQPQLDTRKKTKKDIKGNHPKHQSHYTIEDHASEVSSSNLAAEDNQDHYKPQYLFSEAELDGR
jgi:hypothetical protein